MIECAHPTVPDILLSPYSRGKGLCFRHLQEFDRQQNYDLVVLKHIDEPIRNWLTSDLLDENGFADFALLYYSDGYKVVWANCIGEYESFRVRFPHESGVRFTVGDFPTFFLAGHSVELIMKAILLELMCKHGVNKTEPCVCYTCIGKKYRSHNLTKLRDEIIKKSPESEARLEDKYKTHRDRLNGVLSAEYNISNDQKLSKMLNDIKDYSFTQIRYPKEFLDNRPGTWYIPFFVFAVLYDYYRELHKNK